MSDTSGDQPANRASDSIDRYLDRLLGLLRGDPADVRRTLVEVEDHLRESAAAGMARGLSGLGAAEEAVARFGPPERLARRIHRDAMSVPVGGLVGCGVRSAAGIAGVGLVAIGLSGLVAEALGRLASPDFVAGDLPGVTYTAQRCAEFLALQPDARGDCAKAASLHHWGEVVEYRVAAGLLGLLVLAAWALARRGRPATDVLPRGLVPAVVVALFGVAAVGLLGLSVVQAISGWSDGVGQWLSGGLVSTVVALIGIAWLRRELARPLDAWVPSNGSPIVNE